MIAKSFKLLYILDDIINSSLILKYKDLLQ